MARFSLFLGSLMVLTGMSAPRAVAQDDMKLKEEYIRFARHFSMDWGSSITQEYRLRSAPKRAELLAGGRFTNPVLSNAIGDFQSIAQHYFWSWEERNNTRMTQAEYDKKKRQLRELPYKSDEDVSGYLNKELKAARDKEKRIMEAGAKGFFARAAHARSWKDVLPITRKLAAPPGNKFPLRIGVMYVQNTSAEALTNVTIAIETNSCVEMPGPGRLHVVFFQRLDAGEWVPLPPWLVNKYWKGNTYVAATNVLHCSVWSDQMSAEDVSFDMRRVQAAARGQGASWGLFPGKGYTGSYDTTTSWVLPPISADKLALTVAGGIWRGKDNKSGAARQLVIMEVVGAHFVGIDINIGNRSTQIVEGRILDGKISWIPMVANQGVLGVPHWGTIKDGKMELSYGKDWIPKGTVTLQFSKKKGPKN